MSKFIELMKSNKILTGTIIAAIVLAIIFGSWWPIIIWGVGLVITVVFWDIICRKIVVPVGKLLKNEENKATIIKVGGIIIAVVLFILLVNSCDSCSAPTRNTSTITTAEESSTVETTTEKNTTTEDTTTEDTTTDNTTEEPTTSKTETTTKKPVTDKNTAERETTKKNQSTGGYPEKEVTTTKNNGTVKPTPETTSKEEQTTTVVEKPTTSEKETTTKKPSLIVPSNPFEEETTSKNQTTTEKETTKKEETTTQKPTQKPTTTPEKDTTKKEEQTTTEESTTPEQDRTTVVTISYTSGASVANVLVESANLIDPTFVVSWKMTETNSYKVVQLSSTTWMIKVDVPYNYSSTLRVKVFDADGTMLEIAQKLIKNK